MTADTPRPLERFAEEYLATRQVLLEATDAQWEAGKTPVPREDTTERSRGLASDPTPSIVADGRRMAVRAAVIQVEHDLAAADKALAASRRHLIEALGRWQG